MSRLSSRVKRLENAAQKAKKGIHLIFVEDGESSKEALQRFRDQNPRARDEDIFYLISWRGNQQVEI